MEIFVFEFYYFINNIGVYGVLFSVIKWFLVFGFIYFYMIFVLGVFIYKMNVIYKLIYMIIIGVFIERI